MQKYGIVQDIYAIHTHPTHATITFFGCPSLSPYLSKAHSSPDNTTQSYLLLSVKAPGLLDRQALTRHQRFPTYRTLPFASVLRRLSLGFFMSLKGNGKSHYTPTQKILFDYSESPAAEMTTNL